MTNGQGTARKVVGRDPPDVSHAVVLNTDYLGQLAIEIGADGVAELVQVFLEDAPVRMDAIRRAMARGAIPALRLEAHALVGAARSVGLTRLGLAADLLRSASERAGPDGTCIANLAAALDDSLRLAAEWADAQHSLAAAGT